MLTNRVTWEPLRSIDSATFTGSYLPIGNPLQNQAVICKLVNNSSSLVVISIDGVTDIDVAPANSFWLYDEDTSGSPSHESIPIGTQFFVKGAAGVGSVYLAIQYIVAT
jgi:hypothetical protein